MIHLKNPQGIDYLHMKEKKLEEEHVRNGEVLVQDFNWDHIVTGSVLLPVRPQEQFKPNCRYSQEAQA